MRGRSRVLCGPVGAVPANESRDSALRVYCTSISRKENEKMTICHLDNAHFILYACLLRMCVVNILFFSLRFGVA